MVEPPAQAETQVPGGPPSPARASQAIVPPVDTAAQPADPVAIIDRPPPGQTKLVEVTAAKFVKFGFALSEATVTMLDVDAVLSFADGGKLVIPGMFLRLVDAQPMNLEFKGVTTEPSVVVAAAGEVRLSEQLPFLAHSQTKGLEGQSGKGQDEAPKQAQVVQMTANQTYTHTPGPRTRPFPTLGTGDGDSLQDTNGRFARRVNLDDIQSNSLKGEGAITDRTDRNAVADKTQDGETANTKPVINSDGGGDNASRTLNENVRLVTRVAATDADADKLIYSIVEGRDSGLFTINSRTGQVYFVGAPDYEAPTAADGSNRYELTVQVSDGRDTDQQSLVVTVQNVNEAPTAATITASQVVENAVNGTLVGRVIGSDPDAGAVVTYSFAPGGDAGGRFAIDANTGNVTVLRGDLIDFEASSRQLITVRITDEFGLSSDHSIVLDVTNGNDAPIITSDGGGTTANIPIPETQTAITIVRAIDQDAGHVPTFSIAGGDDAAHFAIDPVTGALRFINPMQFVLPQDADLNNIYEVIVQASDGFGGFDQQIISVELTYGSNAPTNIVLSGNTIAEHAAPGTVVGTAIASDPDPGAVITYSFIPGGDAGGRFVIDPVTGVISVAVGANLDYEDDHNHVVIVRATDETGLSLDRGFIINLLDINEAPVISSNGGGSTALINQSENLTAVTTIVASDPEGAPLTYTIVGGADSGRFTINSVTGALSFVSPPDFENPTDADLNNAYEVIVSVSDGTMSDTQALTVTVTDTGEPPVITSNGGGTSATISVPENDQSVTIVTATDTDAGAVLTYSIVGGADSARFTINPTTGVLTFIAQPNFEAPVDVGANNVYDVVVRVSDGTFNDDQVLAVTVTDLNDVVPVITSDGGGTTAAISLTENSTAVTTVTAADPDTVGTLTYSIVGGADQARFTINATTGLLTFVTGPDFENPTDTGANNVYDVIVRVSDSIYTDDQAIAVTVTNINESAPIITSNGGGTTAAISVAENATAVTTVTAVDPDFGATLTYSIVGGADQGRFTINATTGVLTFIAPPNFEAPTDVGANNVYDVTVRVSDGTNTDDQAIAVTVTNVNEFSPTITSNGGGTTAAISRAENGTSVTTVTATDADAGATLSYSIVGGVDAGRFTINATTGVLSFIAPPDFENPTDTGTNNVYDVVVRVSDGTFTDDQTIAVTITNINEFAPVITSNGGGPTAAISVAENSTAVTTVTATDADAGATLTYSIIGGADQARFTINATTGVLSFVSAPNFEAPTDAGGNNVYDVTVRVSDGTNTDDQVIAVTVTNVNEFAPAITSNGGGTTAAISVSENNIAVTTVTATDADAGATLTYSIIGGADQARFTINATTGVLTFVAPPDFEAPTDVGANNVYDVVVRVSDGSFTDDQTIAVTVTDANDSLPVITSNGGGPTAAISVAENTTAVTTVTAIDPDASGTLTYSIIGGADQARFTINATTGVLTFVSAPNFEAPTDTGANNVYDVIVRVSDGTNTDDQTIAVTITDTNDVTPTITSNGGGTTAAISVVENTTAVTTVTATDPDTVGTLSYSIIGGADQARFTINATTGVLTFISAPDFEAPTDAGANNVYDVVVRVSDGTFTDDQTIAVTVTNSNDNTPVITSNGGGSTAAISIAENTSGVTTVTATDADPGATLTYSIIGGADQARFTINATTGVLTFVSAPNFEAPTDAGGDNVYDVTVRVSDGTNTDDQAIAVTVTNVNEFTPVITSNGGGSTAAISVAENSTAVTTVTATDADAGATLTYSIIGGADQARFSINATTGVLTFVAPPDFEAPTDTGANNVYDVVVRVSDGTFTDDQTIAVTVTNVNESVPVITSNGGGPTAAISVAENSTAVTTVTATDADAGATLTYSIVGGADQGRFAINATTGVLTFIAGPNFEAPTDIGADNVYDVVVRVSDGTNTDDQAIAVTVTNVNEFAPAISSNGGGPTAAISVAENSTAVTTVTATDADAGATLTYSIVGGADQARFTINATTGVLTFISAPDFEAPTDVGGNNVYDVTVRVSDGTFTDDQAIAVTVTNSNDNTPVITSNGGGSTAAISVAENGTAVTTVTATDADPGATLTYSIIGGADQGRFTINATTGVLTFIAGPNFEAPTDVGGDNVYDVTVRVSDGTNTDDQAIAVTVTNVNEFTPVITSNGGGSTAAISAAENSTAVTTVTATDGDAGATLTYSIVGGADQGRFTINATTGVLTFISAPDFEAPTDVGGDNVYDVVVRVSDGTFTDDQTIAVTVTNVNDNAPAITSNGGGPTAAISVAENTTAVTTVVAADPDPGATLTYSIVGGVDQARFTINATTGVLTFVSAPDFENPTDIGADNTYDVIVRVSDGTNTDDQAIAVTVTDTNDVTPTITSDGGGAFANISVSENATAVTTVTASDPDTVGTLTYSIVGGTDQARFTINATTGVLSFVSAPDFENPTDFDANNVYGVVVRVSDGTFTDDQSIAVTVTNQNEAPTITSNGGGTTAAFGFFENYTFPTQVTATDPDAGATLTYAIVGGADQAKFTIDSSGRVYFITAPDFENPTDVGANNTYELIVEVSDGSLTDTQTITITINNENEVPTITSNGGGTTAAISLGENTTAVTTVTATDPDAGATLTYSIVGGADQARFTINATTGVLTFVAPPDFEAPTDVGGNNVYDVVVRVSDGTLTDDQTIAVTVTNVNESAPVITSNGGGVGASISIAENTTAVTTVTATDADAGATLTYSIVGGVDSGDFTINATTGVLTFIGAPNFESPSDFNGDNIYDVVVRVSDGTFTDDQTLAVTVTDVNEFTPVITSNGGGSTAAISMAENGTAVTTVTATDGDTAATLTYSIVGGADQGRFTINATTGVLTFVSAPDFEAPADVGGDNVYDVTVRVSDGTNTDDQAIAVTITDANDNVPVITSNGGGPTAAISIGENTTAVTTVTATDADAGATLTYSIIGGADQARFTINASTGVLTFISAPDFEAPTDVGANNIYDVTVRVSDGTNTDDQAIAVTVTNVNEFAPAITSNGGGSTAAISVAENSTAVTTVTATDADAGATLTYSIIGGADQARFTINASTGVLTFVAPPDFEAPTDVGGNNVYDVTVRVSDGTFTDDQDIAVTITDANEFAPAITSNGGGPTAAISVAENTTGVTTVTATDADPGATLTYSIIGGADQGRFTINATTGVLTFISAPDFETPTDVGGDNIYDVTVRVSDGTFTDDQAIAVTVQDAIIGFSGTAASELFDFTSANDQVSGSAGTGNDTIIGGTLGDTLAGAGDNDSISGGAGADMLFGEDGDDTLIGGTGNDTLNGGNNTDTVDYSGATGSITVNLTTNAVTGADGSDTLVQIERVIASNHADTISGVMTGQYIDAGGGNDEVTLSTGAATMHGGLGSDLLIYAGASSLSVNLTTQTLSGGNVISGFEHITFGSGNDTIIGDTNNNQLLGGAGNDSISGGDGGDFVSGQDGDDTLIGGAGNDIIDGGNNTDTVDYSSSASGVSYTVGTGVVTGDGNDTLTSIERFIGSGQNDTVTGAQTGGYYDLAGGNDTVIFDPGSATVHGGTGNDYFYYNSLGAVSINMAAGTISGGGVLSGFETVSGGFGDDTISGSTLADVIEGYDGNDQLSGSDGNDTLYGSNGNDTLVGGAGNDSLVGGNNTDTVDYSAASGAVNINISLGTTTGAEGNDTLTAIERFIASGHNDTIIGAANGHYADAGGGDDIVYINDGTATVVGGTGNDILYFNSSLASTINMTAGTISGGGVFSGFETVAGGINNDTISGTTGADNILGRDGADSISGLGGNDALWGDNGNDTITGSTGNDTIDGGAGNDSLDGGADFDIVDYRTATSGVTVEVANPGVYVTGGSGTDTLANFEGVWGSNFNDTLYNYSSTSVELRGFDGNDYLISGGNGNSTLIGGMGNDTLDSFTAGDSISGGDGNDLIYKDANSMFVAGNDFKGEAGVDTLYFYGPGNVNLADISANVSTVEIIDLQSDVSVAGNLNNFRGTDATSILGVTGPGNTLTLMLDGNDNFTVAAGEHYTLAGSLYTFYSDAGLTNEIARVSIV